MAPTRAATTNHTAPTTTTTARTAGLRGRSPEAWRKTTVAGAHPVPAPDLINRDSTADTANTRWCGGITYIGRRRSPSAILPGSDR